MLIDFPKEVIAAYDKLSNDLKKLEELGHTNTPLKTLLIFFESLEITDGILRYTGTVPAAQYSPSQDFPTGAFSGNANFASEPQASEGERNLNSPREAVGLYSDIRKLAIELGFFGYELNIQKSK